ncbi:MAG: enoyl-CoA hydratase-related protein [Sterolibacterium sp.]
MSNRHFHLSRTDACLTLQLHDPFSAAVTSTAMAGDIESLCSQIDSDPEVRVVILVFDGYPTSDTSGNDVGDPVAGASIVDAVARISKPVICTLGNGATGPGLELALACDIRISTTDGRFSLPQIRKGLIPYAGGTQRLPRLIGPAKALEMLLTGVSIDAEEACRIGLVHQVVPAADLAATASALALGMAAAAPLSMKLVKEAIYSGMDMTLDQGLRMELDLYLLLFSTEDRTEGISAFRDKRAPKFIGS